jgi:tripartite motif-containing protein 2/3
MEATGKDAILELIKCPICLEIYSDPRMLPCQHSFCRSCLERLSENDGRWGRCPQCRQLFRIPFNGVGSFDVNRTIAQLIETFPKQQIERPALRAKCASCRKEEIISSCEHCKEALCKPCRMTHFDEVKSELGKQLAKIEADSDKLFVKEG